MSIDRTGAPWPGSTYNGFSGPQPAAPAPRTEPAERRKTTRGLLIGGLAAAVTGGLLFGLWARPDFGEDGRAREPVRTAPAAAQMAPAAAPATQVPIEIAPVTPTAPTPSAGRLEVLPPDLARRAEANVLVMPAPRAMAQPRLAPEPPTIAPARVPTPAPSPRGVDASDFRPAPVRPPVVADAAPPPTVRPAFNCRLASGLSQNMVCGDSQLARLDNQLNRSFSRAVRSGVPYAELRAEQNDWIGIREDAARRGGRDAVESVYRQRIRELNALADGDY